MRGCHFHNSLTTDKTFVLLVFCPSLFSRSRMERATFRETWAISRPEPVRSRGPQSNSPEDLELTNEEEDSEGQPRQEWQRGHQSSPFGLNPAGTSRIPEAAQEAGPAPHSSGQRQSSLPANPARPPEQPGWKVPDPHTPTWALGARTQHSQLPGSRLPRLPWRPDALTLYTLVQTRGARMRGEDEEGRLKS